MGYDVHITRRADWWAEGEPAITQGEWAAVVAADVSFEMLGRIEATSPQGMAVGYENTGLAAWTAEGGERVLFDLRDGNIVVNSPGEQALRKMVELAKQLGRAGASRAVGRANGANPVPLVIPCHRVIGSDGSLTGFAGGIEAKRWLLEREAAQAGLFTQEVRAHG